MYLVTFLHTAGRRHRRTGVSMETHTISSNSFQFSEALLTLHPSQLSTWYGPEFNTYLCPAGGRKESEGFACQPVKKVAITANKAGMLDCFVTFQMHNIIADPLMLLWCIEME